MDFAWVVDALRRGLKVRRRAWLLTNPTMYLKMVKDAELKRKVVRVFCGDEKLPHGGLRKKNYSILLTGRNT